MLRRDSDQLLTSLSHIAQIQQREEALMDVTEVEELLLNCLGTKQAAKTSINCNPSSREERGSISSAQRDATTLSSSFTATALLERKGHVEKDIFQDGELEDLMKACSDEEIELCDTHDDSRNSDQRLNTLPHQSEDNQPQDLNIQDLCDEEDSQYMSSSSFKYIKNWKVKVFSLPIDDPLRKILKICDYWIVLEGDTADQSGNIIEKELLTTSTWVVRVLTENCIHAVDGSIYTLLGSMDILSTCLSGTENSSFDSGIFEMGFGEDDHKWKERVLQIIGQDTTDTNNDSIPHIIYSDLMTLYQKELTSKGDNISLENKIVEAELLSGSAIQEANDVVHEVQTKILNPSILPFKSTDIQKDSRKKVDCREKKRDSSQDSFPLNENQCVDSTIRKNSPASKSSEKTSKKVAAPSKPVPTKKKYVLKRVPEAISITKSAKKNRRVSFSDEIMVMEEPKVNPHTPLKKQNASPKKNRFSDEIMAMEEPKVNLHTPSPAKTQGASNSRSPASALFNSLDSPDCLVSRSGRMTKKPSEWWKV